MEAKAKDLLVKIDRFDKNLRNFKPIRSIAYDVQIGDLEDIVKRQEDLMKILQGVETEMDKQMKSAHYLH